MLTEDDWLALILWQCNPHRTHSLAEALRRGLVPREYLAEARAIVESYPYPRQPTASSSSGRFHNDPAWDNVIRALEEDR